LGTFKKRIAIPFMVYFWVGSQTGSPRSAASGGLTNSAHKLKLQPRRRPLVANNERIHRVNGLAG
jgi:hypothetical protein